MLPTEISIFGIPHKIEFIEDYGFVSDESHFGEICYTKAIIKINKNMPEDLQMQTLIHEWIHGVLVMLGQNELTENESLVQTLALAISQTFEIKNDGKNCAE